MSLHGLAAQQAAFAAALDSGRLHHAWLLAGPKGVGKASFAAWAARELLPGEAAAKLIDAGSHSDFIRLERLANDKTGALARSITVDQIRWLRGRLATSTAHGGRRVVVVDSADDLEGRGAPNALLKSLEEPPAGTTFLLVSHAPGRLLPTIRSRCRTLLFAALSDDVMARILAEQLPELAETGRNALIAAAAGSPGLALAFAGQDIVGIDAALDRLASSGDPINAERSALAQSLSLKAALPRYEAFLQRAPAFIADRARGLSGPPLDRALDAWSAAHTLASVAIPQSLVAESVVFEMAGHVAALGAAPPG